MYERAQRLGCSKSGIESALKYPKACPIKIAIYQDKIDRFKQQGYLIVYMDESGFEAETIRSYGYASIGKPCINWYNWQAKKRTNVIGALYKKMLFAFDYFDKNINGDIFYGWCKYTLIPSLKTKCVVVMDNASFHKRLQRLLNRHGHRLLFLPSYSPNLNPIEKKWVQAKFLCQGWMGNNLPKLFYDMGCSSFIMDWL